MAPDSFTFAGGLKLGLASSLHCGGMCGAIASSLMFAFSPSDKPGDGGRALFAAQARRIAVDVTPGAALGGLGSAFYGAFDHASAYLAVRWAGAVALGWIGLSVAGVAPSLSVADRLAVPIAGRLGLGAAGAGSGAFASGLMWGFMPCAMVFGALFCAMHAGGALVGGAVMAACGLATLPAATAVALGLSRLTRLARTPSVRLAVPALASGALCLR